MLFFRPRCIDVHFFLFKKCRVAGTEACDEEGTKVILVCPKNALIYIYIYIYTRKRVQPGTLVHVPGEVGHVMKTILC